MECVMHGAVFLIEYIYLCKQNFTFFYFKFGF
jgi:hypothetical protein